MTETVKSAQSCGSLQELRPKTGREQWTNCAVGSASRQGRLASLGEATTNVAVGFVLALATQQVVLPLFGVHVDLAIHAGIATVFTGLSLARAYLLRRVFDYLAWHRNEDLRLKRERLHRRLAGGPI